MAFGDGAGILSTLQEGVRAINNLATRFSSVFPNSGGTTTTASAGAATLPANPVGFIVVTLPDGTIGKVPYYS